MGSGNGVSHHFSMPGNVYESSALFFQVAGRYILIPHAYEKQIHAVVRILRIHGVPRDTGPAERGLVRSSLARVVRLVHVFLLAREEAGG